MKRQLALLAALLLLLPARPAAADDPAPASRPAPASGPALLNAGTAKDAPGKFRETVFAPTEPIYAGGRLTGNRGHVRAAAVWNRLDESGNAQVIGREEYLRARGVCLFKLAQSRPWPVGKYRVDLSLDGQPAGSFAYSVAEPAAPTAESAKLRTAWLASGADGTLLVAGYLPGDTFHCIAQLADAPADTKFKAVWSLVKAGNVGLTKMGEAEATTGTGEVHFQITRPRPWPVGEYKVDLLVNGKQAASVPFVVLDEQSGTLTEAAMSSDPDGNHPTTVYSPTDTFYALARFSGTTPDTMVVASWIAVEVKGFDANAVIRQTVVYGPRGLFSFNLSNANGWPAGKYKVLLSVDGKAAADLPFEVTAHPASQGLLGSP